MRCPIYLQPQLKMLHHCLCGDPTLKPWREANSTWHAGPISGRRPPLPSASPSPPLGLSLMLPQSAPSKSELARRPQVHNNSCGGVGGGGGGGCTPLWVSPIWEEEGMKWPKTATKMDSSRSSPWVEVGFRELVPGRNFVGNHQRNEF